ncbi:hypothetical protein ACHJH3_10860 [Campylobacter sp. MOP7]|uniref:hypothetical protein n=2 Tax=Campylobacter canis TaxID=3378588 RepID=UPI00387E2D55
MAWDFFRYLRIDEFFIVIVLLGHIIATIMFLAKEYYEKNLSIKMEDFSSRDIEERRTVIMKKCLLIGKYHLFQRTMIGLIVGLCLFFLGIIFMLPNNLELSGMANKIRDKLDSESASYFELYYRTKEYYPIEYGISEPIYPMKSYVGMISCSGDFDPKKCSKYLGSLAKKINQDIYEKNKQEEHYVGKKYQKIDRDINKYKNL